MTRIKRKRDYKSNFIGVRLTEEQHNELKLKANVYTEGNLSEYVLYAALNYEVIYDDLESPELDALIKESARKKNSNLIR